MRITASLGLASDRVYSSLHLCQVRLIPEISIFSLSHIFSHPKMEKGSDERNVFCYTFRSLAAPSLSLVSSPAKSRLSSSFALGEQKRRLLAFPKRVVTL